MLELRIDAYDAEEVMIVAKAMEQIAKLRAKAMDEADKFIAQHGEARRLPEVLPEAVQENAQAEQEAVQAEPKPAPAEPEIPEAPKPKITYAQVRAEATRLVKKDKARMKEILAEFSAAKLGDVAEGDYSTIYERLVSANAE